MKFNMFFNGLVLEGTQEPKGTSNYPIILKSMIRKVRTWTTKIKLSKACKPARHEWA